jgi:hypothetical protein
MIHSIFKQHLHKNEYNDFTMSQLSLFENKELVNLQEASIWASQYLDRAVTASNISYLIQYGRINKYHNNGTTLLCLNELKNYYDNQADEKKWKNKYGENLNWHLSFTEYKESERTKHVHRIHPYKGKFIPQLVEYFLDSHTDEFKKEIYFNKGDIVLDLFCGSGTALVQANELNLHALGVDISSFNAMITNTKVNKHDFVLLRNIISDLTHGLNSFQKTRNNIAFERSLLAELALFNSKYFPSPDYRRKVSRGEINEEKYGKEKEEKFLAIYQSLVKRFGIKIEQDQKDTFLGKWFLFPVREEINYLSSEIAKIENETVKRDISIILSRTIRSCRATTHADLATLKDPVTTTYYCRKHGKICKPIFSLSNWWSTYTKDTLERFRVFANLRTDTFQICLTGDSREIDLINETRKVNKDFAELISNQKIRGIFSSPPYVGLIDYHEQHAYAYELLGLERKDELEIGPLYKGQGKEARDSYSQSLAEVLINCKKYFQDGYDVFLVANDKYNLYPGIAELAGMKIANCFQRPVLNRVEKDRNSTYSETIFHLKEK